MIRVKEEQVRTLISDLKSHGYAVGLRDIAFVLTSRFFEDASIAYLAAFGVSDKEAAKELDSSAKIEDLRTYMKENFFDEDILEDDSEKKSEADEQMSFSELKTGLIRDMEALIELRDSTVTTEDGDQVPALDAKEMATVVGKIADIRVRLVDKFSVSEGAKEQRIVVKNKYNDICPYCGHEVAAKVVFRDK